MRKNKLANSMPEAYIDWIKYDILKHRIYDSYRYEKLIYTLVGMQFVPYDRMDQNRLTDARDLKYRFARSKHFPEELMDETLKSFGGSVLEVLVALSLRIYEETTSGFPTPIKPADLFWTMIETMHLENQVDPDFDEKYVLASVQRMMIHDFKRNGDGGLFQISDDSPHDMRKADMWYQAQWWVTEQWNRMTKLMKPLS